jgi:hypothetical protein
MKKHISVTSLALAAAAAMLAVPAGASAATTSAKATVTVPKCAKGATAKVVVTIKPNSTSAVVEMLVATKFPPTSPSDEPIFDKEYQAYGRLARPNQSAGFPGTGVTRRETVTVPVGKRFLAVGVAFVPGAPAFYAQKSFIVPKCQKAKPKFTG